MKTIMKPMTIAFVFVTLGLFGCASEVPVPVTYERTTQQKMLAAHHWDVLAASVAERLAEALQGADPGAGGSPLVLHVRRPEAPTVFNVAFHDLLVTQLMQRGFGIAITPDENALLVAYDVTYGGNVDVDVDTGLSDVVAADDDLIVNVSVVRGNRYVTRITEIFYIDQFTSEEYFSDAGARVPTRLVEVVGP